MSQNSKKPRVLTLNPRNDLERLIQSFVIDKCSQNLTEGSLHYYDVKMRTFIDYCSSKNVTDISVITPTLLRELLIQLKETGHNEGGVFAVYKAIKSFFLWYEYEYEPEHWKNPIKRVSTPKVPVEPIEGISKDDFNLLLSKCKRNIFHGERDRTILLVLIETGVRAAELLNIDTQDIDFMDSSILIRQGKGRKPRSVFFGKTARKQLRVYLRLRKVNQGALFVTSQDERLTFPGLQEIMRRLAKAADIECPGLHDFRRTFALECLRNKIDIQTIAKLMGHSDLKTITRYLKQSKQDLGSAYKSIIDSE